ncbi:hypothetical protein AB0D08_37290, partial [Kitasatospora sp. NPDC048540]|uniref:hypothetical protein n=1 Tax=Kitasatospora sp. NPDC048540 TaxID=3155634 RepID=UPI0033F7D09E
MTRRATADRAASGPATADRTAGGGTARGGAARFRAAVRGRRATAVTVAVALTAVLAGGAGELTARTLIRDRVAGAAPGLGGLTATTGGSALWALVDRHLPHLDIGSDDAHAGPLSGLSVRARLDDVRLGGPARFAAAADHGDVLVTEEETVTGGAPRDAAAGEGVL